MVSKTSAGTNSALTSTGINGAGWDRRRLLGILATAVAVAVVLLVGLVYALGQVVAAVGEEDSRPSDPATGIVTGDQVSSQTAGGAARRDQIAAAPMLEVPAEAMEPPSIGGGGDAAGAGDQAAPQMQVRL